MTLTILIIVGAIALAALIATTHRALGVVSRSLSESQPRDIPPEFDDSALWRAINDLTTAVAHGIEHVDRNEKRVRGIVVGATRRFESSDHYDAAVDAELDGLPERDEPSGPEEGVLPLQEDVELGSWGAVPGFKV